MRLRYAPQAAAEVNALLAYIAERSPNGAHRVAARITKAERTLIAQPGIGQLTTARLPPLHRFVLSPYPYVIFYEVENGTITVVGVRHAARDPSSMPDQS